MIELVMYESVYKKELILQIANLFEYHTSLIDDDSKLDKNNLEQAEKTLIDWIESDNELFIIKHKSELAGFVYISYRGDNVAWIEDIYVDEKKRNMGIATSAIKKAEEIIKSKPGYTAICFDVVPRNEKALRLYHKLGYDSLSIITVRKELYENKRDRKEDVLGMEFWV
jgi:ribosomal protein S18 acetylase RimI-like enzyme